MYGVLFIRLAALASDVVECEFSVFQGFITGFIVCCFVRVLAVAVAILAARIGVARFAAKCFVRVRRWMRLLLRLRSWGQHRVSRASSSVLMVESS